MIYVEHLKHDYKKTLEIHIRNGLARGWKLVSCSTVDTLWSFKWHNKESTIVWDR